MVWRNPYVDPNEPVAFRVPRGVESVRLASVLLLVCVVKNFEEFVQNIEYFVDVAADYRSDFVVFPELFTIPLLSFEPEGLSPMEAIDRMTEHRAPIVADLSRMAQRNNIHNVGGSHQTRTDDGSIQNVA